MGKSLASRRRQASILKFFGPSSDRSLTPPSASKLLPKRADTTVPEKSALLSSRPHDTPCMTDPEEPGSQDSSMSLVVPHPVRSLFAVRKRGTPDGENASDTHDDMDDAPLLPQTRVAKKSRRISKSDDEHNSDNESLPFVAGASKLNDMSWNEDKVISCIAENRKSTADCGGNLPCSPLTAYKRGSAPLPGLQAARRRLAMIDLSGKHSEEEGGWCDQNPWSVQVRDAQLRTPDHPDYDPQTLHIPVNVLAKMSPFQKQFWELKSRYYNTMLFVKKGAFMEAYDIDADIVHRELGLNYTGGGRASMRCAGVPESSLNRHAARLIDLGYRVGVVAQTETANAADKRKASQKHSQSSANDKTSKVCQRTLVRILTKATVTDDELLRDHRARFVVALYEADQSTINTEGEITVGVCHVDAASGRVTLGQYLDDNRRSWTEKLLSTLRPPEIIVPLKSSISPRMRSLLRWFSTGATPVDIIHRSESEGFQPMTSRWFRTYLASPSNQESASKLTDSYFASNPLAAKAFGAIGTYLADLLIDKEVLSLGNYVLLPSARSEHDACQLAGLPPVKDLSNSSGHLTSNHASALEVKAEEGDVLDDRVCDDDCYDPSRSVNGGLQMDSATMANLEVLANVMDGSEREALISVVDRAVTPPGRRLLRRWIADPLVLSAAINDRLNAVEALQSVDGHTCSSIRRLLASGPDLERWLARLHQIAVVDDVAVMFDDTNARRVKEFVKVLRGVQSTLEALEKLRAALPSDVKARRLMWLLTPGSGFSSEARNDLDFFFDDAFDIHAAETEGEMFPKIGAAPAFDDAKAALEDVEKELNDELQHWQQVLQDDSIAFYHRGKETYQLEIKVSTLRGKRIPNVFTPVSEAKNVKRYYTDRIKELVKCHVDVSESFAQAGMNVLRDIVTRFDDRRDVWSGIVKVSAEVDALLGLAIASYGDGSGGMVRPQILPESYPCPIFECEQLRHPVLAAKAGSSFVANDTALGGKQTIALITGSNCSGKSTLSRQVAVAVILAQIGMFVPASSMKLRPFTSLFARAGSRDEISRGRSTFMVEMEEAALIVNTATDRSLVIVDELCSGTTAQDAHAISHATIDHLLNIGCLTIFCTHADSLAVEFAGRVGNFTMAADVDEDKKTILFLYKLVPGVTSHSRGAFCARVAGIPAKVADKAEEVAKSHEDSIRFNRESVKFSTVVNGLNKLGDEEVHNLFMAVSA